VADFCEHGNEFSVSLKQLEIYCVLVELLACEKEFRSLELVLGKLSKIVMKIARRLLRFY
jgi:hypothetical protein